MSQHTEKITPKLPKAEKFVQDWLIKNNHTYGSGVTLYVDVAVKILSQYASLVKESEVKVKGGKWVTPTEVPERALFLNWRIKDSKIPVLFDMWSPLKDTFFIRYGPGESEEMEMSELEYLKETTLESIQETGCSCNRHMCSYPDCPHCAYDENEGKEVKQGEQLSEEYFKKYFTGEEAVLLGDIGLADSVIEFATQYGKLLRSQPVGTNTVELDKIKKAQSDAIDWAVNELQDDRTFAQPVIVQKIEVKMTKKCKKGHQYLLTSGKGWSCRFCGKLLGETK